MFCERQQNNCKLYFQTSFNALTLLVGLQEKHLACKNRVRCWHGHLSGTRCNDWNKVQNNLHVILPPNHVLLH